MEAVRASEKLTSAYKTIAAITQKTIIRQSSRKVHEPLLHCLKTVFIFRLYIYSTRPPHGSLGVPLARCWCDNENRSSDASSGNRTPPWQSSGLLNSNFAVALLICLF